MTCRWNVKILSTILGLKSVPGFHKIISYFFVYVYAEGSRIAFDILRLLSISWKK